MRLALDLLREQDVENPEVKDKLSKLLELMFPFFHWNVKDRPVGKVFGYYATFTKFLERVKIFMVMAKHNTPPMHTMACHGVFDLQNQGFLTSDEATKINAASRAAASFLDSDEGQPVQPQQQSRKRTRKQATLREGDAVDQPSEDEMFGDEQVEEFPVFLDRETGKPLPEAILERFLEQNPLQDVADEDQMGGGVEQSTKFKARPLPLDPIMWYLQNLPGLSEELRQAQEILVELLKMMLSKSRQWHQLASDPEDMEVVWKPKAATSPLTDEMKGAVLRMFGISDLVVNTKAQQAIVFSRLIQIGGEKMIGEVVHTLVESQAVVDNLATFLLIFNQAVIDHYHEHGDWTSLVFSLVHHFFGAFIIKANESWKKKLLCQGYTMDSYISFPGKRALAAALCDKSDEEVAGRCKLVVDKFKPISFRCSHRQKVPDVLTGFSFTIGVSYDYLKNEYVVVVQELLFGVLGKVIACEAPIDMDIFPMYTSFGKNDPFDKLVQVVCSFCTAKQAELDGGPVVNQVCYHAADFTLSILRNFIDGFDVEQLFEWGSDAEELWEIIGRTDKILPERNLESKGIPEIFKSLAELLKAIGDTNYLKEKLDWIQSSSFRALVLAAIMPTFKVSADAEGFSEDDPRVELQKIPAFILSGKTLVLNERFIHITPDDKTIRPEEMPHRWSEHVKHDIWAGLNE